MLNIGFAPSAHESYPLQVPSEKGVLAVYCDPTNYAKTIRFEKILVDILKLLRSSSMKMLSLKETELCGFRIYSCSDHDKTNQHPVLYKGRVQPIRGPCIICKKDMTSLTKEEAFAILKTARLMMINGDMSVCVNILETMNNEYDVQNSGELVS